MRIDEYLDAMCGEIRWKTARAQVREEIRTHIEQRADEYAAAGDSRDLAEAKAVTQMGDAAKTGRELNKLHRPRYDWVLIGAVAALVILGFFQAITAQSDVLIKYPLGWIGGLITGIAGCVLFSLVNIRSLLGKIRHPAAINLTCVAGLFLCSILYLFQAYVPLQVSVLINYLLFFSMVFSMVAWVSQIKTKKEWRLFIIAAIASAAALYLTDTFVLEYMLIVWLLVWMNLTGKKHSLLLAVVGVGLIIRSDFARHTS
jgi:hypothetical protein